MRKPSVIVVGRGIVGLSVARECALRGFSTKVIGPSPTEPRFAAATNAAVGVCSLKGNVLASTALFAAKVAGQREVRPWLAGLMSESGMHIPHSFEGITEPFFDATGFAAIRERVFHRKFTGANRLELLSLADLQRSTPDALVLAGKRAPRGAFRYSDDIWFDPVSALSALIPSIEGYGGEVVDDVVMCIEPRPDGVCVTCEGGQHRAAKAILACGAFANDLLAASGLLGIEQQLVPGETIVGPCRHTAALNAGKTNFVSAAGTARYGSTSRSVAAAPATAADLAADLANRLGITWGQAVIERGEAQVLSGVRGRFKDQAPAFGPLNFPGFAESLWAALGFHKSGLQLAPLFARALISWIEGVPPSPPLSSLTTARFQRCH